MNDNETSDKIKRELEEEQCELILTKLGKYFKEEACKRFEEWDEEAEDIELPEELDRKLLAIAKRYEEAAAEERKRSRRRYMRVGGFMLAILVCVGGVSLMSSEALRNNMHNILFKSGDGNVNVEFKEANPGVEIPEDIDTLLYPAYLPDGYVLESFVNHGELIKLSFSDDKIGDQIIISYEKRDRILSLDSEKSENEIVDINGKDAILHDREFEDDIILQLEDYDVLLSCTKKYIDKDEMIIIAENIREYSRDDIISS